AALAPGPLTIDGTETAAVFTIPLDVIVRELTEGTVKVGEWTVETQLLDYENRRVWGLTGHILRSFVDAWTVPVSPLRDAVEAVLAS
ncbi:MAG: hypothetical protein JOZ86_12325, partial [Candidatus Eremiobacteraeota bacterium]|nr:hypothetical protein [Candidatus Eremiobacteraeota bacterium]